MGKCESPFAFGPGIHRLAGRTLIDSTPGVLKAWATFAKDYSLDATEVARAAHGRRLYDTLKEWCRIEDEEQLQVCTLGYLVGWMAYIDTGRS